MTTENEVKVTKAKVVEKDPWKEMVKIKLPRAAFGEPNFELVGVNGKLFKVKKGEEMEVPKPIAEELEISFTMKDKRDEYLASLVK